MNISKELLSEVINIKIEDIIDLKMFGKDLKYYEKCLLKFCCDGRLSNHKDSICKSINIYELAHKCKEWALNKGYYISSNIYDNNGCCQLFKDNSSVCNECGEIESLEHFHSSCESGAIFKACQWILDNKKEGN